jgi:tetratricopeptide (TPR) repeat protein
MGLKGLQAALLFVLVTSAAAAQLRMTDAEAAQLKQQIQTALEAQKANRLDEAAAGFEAVLKKLPDLAEAHMSLGIIRSDQFRYVEAIPELQKALQLKAGLNNARAYLGLDYLRTGETSKAVEQLEMALKSDPANPKINGWLGMAYVAAGLFRPAIVRLEVAVEAEPKSVLFLAYLARAYAGMTALVNQQLFDLAPNSPEAHLALGQSYAASGNPEEAADEYQAAAAMNPKLPGVNAALGDMYMESGKLAQAEEAYRKELELAPDAPGVQFRVGMALAELGRAAEALPYLERAVKQDPSNGDALFYLGKVRFDLEQFPGAEESLRAALDRHLSPKRLIALHYQLWMLYRRMGKVDEANKHLQIFKQLAAEQAAKKRATR